MADRNRSAARRKDGPGRLFLPFLLLAALPQGGCSETQAQPPAQRRDAAPPALQHLAERAQPGVLGAAILDLGTHRLWSVNGDTPLPLQSVFKLPLGIYVLHLAESGRLSLDDEHRLGRADLSIFHSPISEAFGRRQTYTIRELVAAAVSESDNAAADILLERAGGPRALTRFFQDRGLRSFRVDRYERELQPDSVGLPTSAGRMESAEAYRNYRAGVPLEVRQAGMARYLADPRDRMSANDAVRMLAMLDAGELLDASNTRFLMDVLLGTRSGRNRLKAGLPDGARLYHKTGTSADVGAVNGATNDIGVIVLPDGRKLAVAAFLSGSDHPADRREHLLAEVARIASGRAPVPAPDATRVRGRR